MLDPILNILVQNGYLDEQGAADLQDLAKTESKSVRQTVIDQQILTEDDLLGCLAADQETAEPVHLGPGMIQRRNAQESVFPGLPVMVLLHFAGVHQAAVSVDDRLRESGGAG